MWTRLAVCSLLSLIACSGAGTTDAGAVAGGGNGGSGGAGLGGSSGGSGAGGTGGTGGTSDIGGMSGSSGQSAGTPGCGLDEKTGDLDETLSIQGVARTYRVHVPPGTTGSDPKTLVFVFHGFTETPAQIADISRMSAKADQQGFLVVYPLGLGTNWNAGTCCGSSTGTVDDVGFFDAMVNSIGAKHCIDPKRVFATGLSNGAMFAHRLACERAATVAAISPVAGPNMVASCAPTRPVPVLEFHGTADPVVPFAGGGVSLAAPVQTTIAAWEATDGCTDSVAKTVYAKGDVTCAAKSMCAGGAVVELCTIQDGGHQWPGGTSAGLYGKLSTDIDASAAMLAFFQAHPMP